MAWEELRQLEGIRRQAAEPAVAYAFDHPDDYPSHDAVEKAFGELLARTPPGARVFACGNSAGVPTVTGAHDRLTTFGLGAGNAMRVELLGGQLGGSCSSSGEPGSLVGTMLVTSDHQEHTP